MLLRLRAPQDTLIDNRKRLRAQLLHLVIKHGVGERRLQLLQKEEVEKLLFIMQH